MGKPGRQANFELLRIIAMFMEGLRIFHFRRLVQYATLSTKKVEMTQVQQAMKKVFMNIRGKFMTSNCVNSAL